VLQHPVKRPVAVLKVFERLVETAADRLVKVVSNLLPPGALWDVERVVESWCFGSLLGFRLRATTSQLVSDHLLLLCFELVGGVLQEQHPEDVLLVGRGLHRTAEHVSGSKQMTLELRKGQSRHISTFSS